MRIADLAAPYLPATATVVELDSGGPDLTPYLPPGEPAPRERRTPREVAGEGLGPGALLVAAVGPDPADGAVADLLAALPGLRPGARLLVAGAWDGRDLPFHELLQGLTAARVQVQQVAALDYDRLRVGLVGLAVEAPVAPRDHLGRPMLDPADAPASPEALLRLVNEHLLSDFVARRLRVHATELEARLADTRRGPRSAPASGDGEARERVRRLEQEKAALAGALERSDSRVRSLERAVARLEGSTSLRLGRLLVGAARDPRRAALDLPAGMVSLWRARSARRALPAGSGTPGPAPAAGAAPPPPAPPRARPCPPRSSGPTRPGGCSCPSARSPSRRGTASRSRGSSPRRAPPRWPPTRASRP